ncbi:MAG: N(G),N(G)-dimethylarginine dimethylaminohydrolase [Alphaproteobacteria bacterium]|nr:N(G),N(G)-dimethylarginine dimethylaminohydrolase [Alphaproteobacteria bacterium]MDE2336643.1 N(G),N(G)-dimethylarginine dimethylaminohydrolase [Alphaproteobacteria bacterium]
MAVVEMFDRISSALICPPAGNLAAAAALGVPDAGRAGSQHWKYVEALRQCGADVVTVTAAEGLPQACLIGNAAVMADHLAVIGNFSDNSPRQGEQRGIAAALAGEKFLKFVTAPGLLDGDDVLRVDNHFYIGLSDRTNQEGAAQLAFFLTEFGYGVTMLEPPADAALRLNAAATSLGQNTLLVREELARHFAFLTFDKIIVPRHARGAAAAVFANGAVLLPAGYAETAADIRKTGRPVIEVNISEFEKIGGTLKNLSLRLPKTAAQAPVELPRRENSAAAV